MRERETTYIANGIAVYDDTIVDHFVTTDTEYGGIVHDGTDRTLCTAKAVPDKDNPQGYGVVYAETNSDPVVMCEGNEVEFLKLVSDCENGKPDIENAREELLEVADKLKESEDEQDKELGHYLRGAMLGIDPKEHEFNVKR